MPKARRGEVWSLLAERGGLRDLEAEWAERFPNLASEYDSLKSQLTSHQHAILIDLGNFPSSFLCKDLHYLLRPHISQSWLLQRRPGSRPVRLI